ncbi:hypothetical protein MSG28_010977 [Choristoneura fumiferana]|uniref:Uncharacterized protein n=1 Tax=Choristoneura fumiferana TaxID=7141 RepID=A0ACC0KPG7_CHOFU|nr:hypothetical protein MSG28_010977 [Choristoneura fumiferana]
MPSDSENAIELTPSPCPNIIPVQLGLRNDVIALEATVGSNVETALPRRRLTPRKGRSTRPATRTAPATSDSDPTHDVCPPALDNQASNQVVKEKVKKSKMLHELTPDEPEEKRAKGVIGCCSICLEEFGRADPAKDIQKRRAGSIG